MRARVARIPVVLALAVGLAGCAQDMVPFPSLPVPVDGSGGMMTPAQQQQAIDDLKGGTEQQQAAVPTAPPGAKTKVATAPSAAP